MTDDRGVVVQHEGSIDRLVVEEVVQLLGYAPREVIAVHMDGRWVQVLTKGRRKGSADIEHRHLVIP